MPLFCATLLLAFAVYLLGSLWFALGDTEAGWVREEGLQTFGLNKQVARSLEWALAKLPPSSLKITVELKTPGERWLGIFATCVSLVCGSVFISFVTNAMASLTRSTLHLRQILQAVQKYCSLYGIPHSYSRQIKRYTQRDHQRLELGRHIQLLHELPGGMLAELFQYARSQTLQQHPFFREVGKCNYLMEVDLCSLAVSEIYHLPGDTIFDVNHKTQGMYLMAHGLALYSCSSLELMPRIGTRNSRGDGSQMRTMAILNSILPMLKGNFKSNYLTILCDIIFHPETRAKRFIIDLWWLSPPLNHSEAKLKTAPRQHGLVASTASRLYGCDLER